MSATRSAESQRTWAAIDEEKQRDRFIRRVCITAWGVTFVVMLVVCVLVGMLAARMMKSVAVGAAQWPDVVGVVMPCIIAFGVVALLVAALSTVGVFLRLRTTTLHEVQARLAALEEMLAARPDGAI